MKQNVNHEERISKAATSANFLLPVVGRRVSGFRLLMIEAETGLIIIL